MPARVKLSRVGEGRRAALAQKSVLSMYVIPAMLLWDE